MPNPSDDARFLEPLLTSELPQITRSDADLAAFAPPRGALPSTDTSGRMHVTSRFKKPAGHAIIENERTGTIGRRPENALSPAQFLRALVAQGIESVS